MSRIALLALALAPFTGCAYAKARARDFADVFRFEGQVGYGLQAHANAGELLHAGVGSSRHWSGGLLYGQTGTQDLTEDHLPLSLVWTFATPSREHVHRIRMVVDGQPVWHRCYMIFPAALNPSHLAKPEIHYFDLEAGFLAGVVGAEAGISLGELGDLLMGLFKFSEAWTFLDPAGDDPEEDREDKRLWMPRRSREGIILPD